jgi:hypothetical protein
MKIDPIDSRWLKSFIIFIMVITTIPYFLGFQYQGSDFKFSGFLFGVEDGNSYIAKMLTGSYHSWLFRTPYTLYPQSGVLAFLPYILLGKLASPPGLHEQLVVLFQVFRLVSILLCVLATYQFMSLWVHDVKLRRYLLVLAILGGGLGWLDVVGLSSLWSGRLPLEFYSPESFGFLALYGLPHLAAGRAFLLWGFVLFFSTVENNMFPISNIVKAGICWTFVGLMQPLTVVAGWAVLLTFYFIFFMDMCIRKKINIEKENGFLWLKKGILLIIISSPIVLYNYISFTTDPFLRNWTDQNIITSPPLVDYLLAYGVILPFAIVGSLKILKKRNILGFLLVGWLVAFPILAYAPYNLQRRLPEGIWIALLALAGVMIEELKPKWKIGSAILILPGLLVPTIIIAGGISAIIHPSPPIYISKGEANIFQFLQKKEFQGEGVIADYETSNAIPAWAPVKTAIGHGPESIKLSEWLPIINEVFTSDLENKKLQDLIDNNDLHYLIISPLALKNNPMWLSPSSSLFELIDQEGDWRLYRIR